MTARWGGSVQRYTLPALWCVRTRWIMTIKTSSEAKPTRKPVRTPPLICHLPGLFHILMTWLQLSHTYAQRSNDNSMRRDTRLTGKLQLVGTGSVSQCEAIRDLIRIQGGHRPDQKEQAENQTFTFESNFKRKRHYLKGFLQSLTAWSSRQTAGWRGVQTAVQSNHHL